MIQIFGDYLLLSTKNTSYAMRVLQTGQLEHIYYGRKLRADMESDLYPLVSKNGCAPGNTIIYDQQHWDYSLENMCLEVGTCGKGDIRDPFIEVVHSDGSFTSDFLYESAEILGRKPEYKTMPTAYPDEPEGESAEAGNSLKVVLVDRNYSLKLEIVYTLFYDTDVITKMVTLVNESDKSAQIKRLMSNQIDFEGSGYRFTSFNGSWTREMHKHEHILTAGKHVNSSYTGTSSNRANSFIMLSDPNTTEDFGECYGFNLIYSGNHYESAEVSAFNQTRLLMGINPQSFSYELLPGESFEAPESVMTYSNSGFNGMSHNMHRFVNDNIVRGTYKKKERPILLNSWEACYFDINESKMLSLAKEAKKIGCELFVMDDGWFGKRNDDSSSLGDWYVNKTKLPGGIKQLADKINALGLSFGIWVEPEMINENSDLYRKHPEWALANPSISQSLGRNQMLLDLTQKPVREYIIEAMTEVFSSGNIAYVKWDMNRIVSDAFSKALDKDHQGEVFHRYVCGLYEVLKALTDRFPDILFEGCASGGNRFDLGMLCYFPQIWASDDTDAIERSYIQTGLSYGYPQSTYTCHVSGCPNHQTLRRTPIETRFNIASFGVLGYEINLKDSSSEELEIMKAQIEYYKEHRQTLQFGDFYRGRSLYDGKLLEWTIVSEDKSEALTVSLQNQVEPNSPQHRVYIKGLDPDSKYTLTNRNLNFCVKDFGDLINNIAPVHIKQDSLVHNMINKFYKMNGEKEEYTAYGDVFNNTGISMIQGFTGTGLNEKVKYFQDFSSRLYLLKRQ